MSCNRNKRDTTCIEDRFTTWDARDGLIERKLDVERVALARALRSHLESRVLVHDGRTVVFD